MKENNKNPNIICSIALEHFSLGLVKMLKERIKEPFKHAASNNEKALIFVIQKHHARRLHYDLGLEMDGVFKKLGCAKRAACKAGR